MCDILNERKNGQESNNGSVESMSEHHDINDETLDALYKEQLQMLRDLVMKQNCVHDNELCGKWIRIFSKTSKGEKLARNCLCGLMQQQLSELGYLDKPFTNLENCNRDLEQVLRDFDLQSNSNDSLNTEFTINCSNDVLDNGNGNDGIQTITRDISIRFKDAYSDVITSNRSAMLTELTCQENTLQTENVQLRLELEALRLKLTEKQIENVKLRELTHISNNKTKSNFQLENLHHLKSLLLNALSFIVEHDLPAVIADDNAAIEANALNYPLFEKLLQDFIASDVDFMANVQKFDALYQKHWNAVITRRYQQQRHTLACHIARRVEKTKMKLRKRYDRRLRIHNWAHRVQLKLVKLKCFSALRHIFIETQQDTETMKVWDVLRALEEKYQKAMNEIQ